jgi:hypothetical protein
VKKIFDKIMKDADDRVLRNNDGNKDVMIYLDRKKFKVDKAINAVTKEIKFDRPTHVVFVDDEPGKNFGHRCHYLLYNAETGEYIKKVQAEFPYFLNERPETLEVIRSSKTTERYRHKKKMRMMLDLAKLSAYRKLAPFPLKFQIRGRRYAILFSGGSNGRHVNDMEFLYRTLVDVYGYNTSDIFVLNYDGTVNYSQDTWSSGWTEPPVTDGFGPDGSAWQMVVNGRGDRAAFQSVISTLQSRIQPWDCLLIHTNNHGWYDASGGFMSAYPYPDRYYANDFAADLAALPQFKTLLVIMEQCASGSFAEPIMDNTPATNTVFQSAVPDDESSWGGWPFDPWAEKWISAMAGVRGDGSALAVSPDDNLDTLISSWEAYDYALSHDNPVLSESSPDLSEKVYLCRCLTTLKLIKEWKEFKEIKEPKEWLEPKQVLEPKQIMEPKHTLEGPDVQVPYEQLQWAYGQLTERVEKMEDVVNRLTPFIRAEERPDLKLKAKDKPK